MVSLLFSRCNGCNSQRVGGKEGQFSDPSQVLPVLISI